MGVDSKGLTLWVVLESFSLRYNEEYEVRPTSCSNH